MFKEKEITELIENICKELKQIKLMLKNNILKEAFKKLNQKGETNNG